MLTVCHFATLAFWIARASGSNVEAIKQYHECKNLKMIKKSLNYGYGRLFLRLFFANIGFKLVKI